MSKKTNYPRREPVTATLQNQYNSKNLFLYQQIKIAFTFQKISFFLQQKESTTGTYNWSKYREKTDNVVPFPY